MWSLLVLLACTEPALSLPVIEMGACGMFKEFPLGEISHYAAFIALDEGFLDPMVKNKEFSANMRMVNTACDPAVVSKVALPMLLGQGDAIGRIKSDTVDVPPVRVMLGCACSGSSTVMSQLAAPLEVTVVSGSATSPSLSNKAQHPFFARVIPSDSKQGAGLAALVKNLAESAPDGWSRIVLLYTEELYSEGIANAFAMDPSVSNMTILKEPLPWLPVRSSQEAADYDYARILTIAKRIAAHRPLPRIFGLPVNPKDIAAPLVRAFHEVGLFNEHSVVFTSEAVVEGIRREFDRVVNERANWHLASIGKPAEALWANGSDAYDWAGLHGVIDGWLALVPNWQGARSASIDFHNFWTGLTREKLLAAGMPASSQIETTWFKDLETFTASMWYSFWFDAVTAVLVGVGDLFAAGAAPEEVRGSKLRDAIFQARFEGLTGNIVFDGNGDRLGSYKIVNLRGRDDVDVGIYDAGLGQVSFVRRPIFPSGGEQVPADRPRPCPAGTEIYGQLCQACQHGHFAPLSDSVCVPCTKGSYAAELGASVCSPSPLGSAVQDAGQASATLCEPGFSSPDLGADHCNPCRAGFFAAAWGTSECTWCEQGTFANSTAAVACSPCPVGETTIGLASSDSAQCVCEAGSYRPLTGNVCIPCSDGLDCATGSDMTSIPTDGQGNGVYPKARPGYYTDMDLSVFKCWGEQSRCKGGAPGQTCAEGRTGIACANCIAGWRASSNGGCKVCSGADVAPFAVAIVAGTSLSVLFYMWVDTQDFLTRSMAMTCASLALGQFVTVMQQLSITAKLRLAWPEPLASVFELVAVFSLDIKVLRLQCVFNSTPTGTFVVKLLVFAAVLCLVVPTHCIVVACRHSMAFTERLPSLICAVGTIILIYYIPIIMAAIGPVQCLGNPNGLSTVREYQSVICWESGEHACMVAIGVVSMIVPLSYLAMSARAVWQLPSRMSQGDFTFVQKYAFLFMRYTPRRYWFVLVHMARSLAFSFITLAPVVVLQIVLTQILMIAQLIVSVRTWPWRAYWANMIEVFTTVVMLMLLCFSAFFVEGEPVESVAWAAAGLIILMVGSFVPSVMYVVFVHFSHRSRKPFKFFLCHHKTGAGSLARLLKCMLQEHKLVQKGVWLDTDDLKDLTKLFDYAATQTDIFVVLCSNEIFSRPWCIGEMVAAMHNGVTTARVVLPGFTGPSPNFVANYAVYVPDVTKLAEHGITVAHVQKALLWVMDQTSVVVPDVLTLLSAKVIVEELVNVEEFVKVEEGTPAVDRISLNRRFSASMMGQVYNQAKSFSHLSVPAGANAALSIAVRTAAMLADCSTMETYASALVLVHMLRPLLAHMPQKMPVLLPADSEMPNTVRLVLILCSAGFFHNIACLRALMEAAQLNAKYVPIITDDSFRFPLDTFFTEQSGMIANVTSTPDVLADVARQTFQAIAIVFQPALYSSTKGVLLAKASEVVERMGEASVPLPTLSWPQVATPAADAPKNGERRETKQEADSEGIGQEDLEDVN
eukprot:CAMPEP_0203850168 /NCGR_PEP_ID=MMETSP0359-20131031/6613_1 /ASSEMBLY_ACC=CAM_ASM_000338 /TAXON_ID=268821 /ORGANISM="Scrippsiella Hangoei, Strain SHTV-5" /LENGTH=1503 /DNA_ID=CAMNT_0050766029 /DNA_START=36 /DNA_END=4547 /DNA_ORIENTATION=+